MVLKHMRSNVSAILGWPVCDVHCEYVLCVCVHLTVADKYFCI